MTQAAKPLPIWLTLEAGLGQRTDTSEFAKPPSGPVTGEVSQGGLSLFILTIMEIHTARGTIVMFFKEM